MLPAAVHLRQGEYVQYLEVERYGTIPGEYDTGDDFIGPVEVARPAGLTSLRHALIEHAGTTTPPGRPFVHPETGETILIGGDPPQFRTRLQVVDVSAAKFAQRHSYEFVPEPVSIVLQEGGGLAVLVQFVIEGDAEPETEALRRLIRPLLARTGSVVEHIDSTPEGSYDFRTAIVVTGPDFWVVDVYISVPTRGKDVEFALSVGYDALAVLEAAEHGELTAKTALALLEGGRPGVMIGQPEQDWLECKSEPYADTVEGRFELAKDVSAFANSARGGVIIVGLRTRSVGGRDLIASVRPIPADTRLRDRYLKLIEHRVFPRPIGLRIEAFPQAGQTALTVISIPPQPPALQPFIVRGSLRHRRTVGSQIAIFVRRGDATTVIGAEELHSLLVAGRAALGYDRAS
jgi:hypothetical protein